MSGHLGPRWGRLESACCVRSLVLSTRLLGTRETMIINHTDCGMLKFTGSELEERLRKENEMPPTTSTG